MALHGTWHRQVCHALVVLCLHVAGSARADDVLPAWPRLGERPEDIADLNLEDMLKSPVIESAARRKQPLNDAPATVTQFEADEISSAGITTFSDILRRVPGLFVLERKAKTLEVGMRANYRVLLLVDGRLFSTGDNTAFWDALPVHPAEIERIEVLRGPGSIVFGSDGLSGVVNIVTKRPLDRPNAEVLVGAGLAVQPDKPHDGSGWRARSRQWLFVLDREQQRTNAGGKADAFGGAVARVDRLAGDRATRAR